MSDSERHGSSPLLAGPGTNVAAARRALADAFRRADMDTPDLDARVLIGHALALDHAGLVSAAARTLSGEETAAIEAIAARRLAGEPVARIVGWKEFWGLPLRLAAATLVPRPETELVVETALAALDAQGLHRQPLRIADIGTGSGALLLALLSELPRAFAVGTDISAAALAVARANARALGLSERAGFVMCELGVALAGGFDLIVSNPPYVRSHDIAGLPREVRNHDPILALDGGTDGLHCYRAIASDADRLLGRRGHLVVELGAGAAADVAGLFRAVGLAPGRPRADLAGVARALQISRTGCV
jgi:release factor glutamine methyltransferase